MANNVLSVSRHVIDIDGGACRFCGCFLAASATECFCQLKFCQIGNKASIDYWFVVFICSSRRFHQTIIYSFLFHFTRNTLRFMKECFFRRIYGVVYGYFTSVELDTLLVEHFFVCKCERRKRKVVLFLPSLKRSVKSETKNFRAAEHDEDVD